MSQPEGNSRQAQIRFACWVLLLVPLLTILFAYLLDRSRQGRQLPSWLGIARVGLLVVAAYCLVAPFLMQRVIARSAERLRAKGHDPTLSAAMICVGSSVGPSAFAMLLTMAGAPSALVYTWAPVSLLSAAWWSWRYRHVLVAIGRRAA